MKGLSVDVYRGPHGDCTAGGATATKNSFTLIDEAVSGPTEVEEDEVYLVIVRRRLPRGEYLHVEPRINNETLKKKGYVGAMFGGNFVYTCDSRFRTVSSRPLPVHDRFETTEFYNSMD